MLIRGMLDRIEKEEKLEQKRQKKQESAEERQKRLNTVTQQRALFKHKEALKKDILKKRAAMEKSLQQEIYVSHSPVDMATFHWPLLTQILMVQMLELRSFVMVFGYISSCACTVHVFMFLPLCMHITCFVGHLMYK